MSGVVLSVVTTRAARDPQRATVRIKHEREASPRIAPGMCGELTQLDTGERPKYRLKIP